MTAVPSLIKSLYSDKIELANMKEHITRSITLLQKEFKQFQNDLCNELKLQISATNGKPIQTQLPTSNMCDDLPNVHNDLQEALQSVKNDLHKFWQTIKTDLEQHLSSTIAETIQNTMTNLQTIITNEVNRDSFETPQSLQLQAKTEQNFP